MVDLDNLTENLLDNLDTVLDHFNINYQRYPNRYSMSCPIHGGNNSEAVSLFIGKRAYVPNWKCFTNQCELQFGKGIFGFFKGLLSETEQRSFTNTETIKWLSKFLDVDINLTVTQDNKIKKDFIGLFGENVTEDAVIEHNIVTGLRSVSLDGFSDSILEKYEIRLSIDEIYELQNRVIFPIYDTEHKNIVGLSGRSIYNRCEKCNMFHKFSCPTYNLYNYCKWKHSSGFIGTNHLFNYWFAKHYILKSNTAILVEGPKDVLKLEASGIQNSVASFGLNLSDKQQELLIQAGTINLILGTDNDEEGQKAQKLLEENHSHIFNIVRLTLPKKDFGEMSIDEIRNFMKEELI